jgi:hypothetical protein
MTASPGDSPDALPRLAPSAPFSGPPVTTQMFEPGTSLGYSHISCTTPSTRSSRSVSRSQS